MIKVTKILRRSNVNTQWWFSTPAGTNFTSYRATNYGSKTSQPGISLSNDGLTCTFSSNWDSQASFDAMMADTKIQTAIADYDAYNAANGITDLGTQITPV